MIETSTGERTCSSWWSNCFQENYAVNSYFALVCHLPHSNKVFIYRIYHWHFWTYRNKWEKLWDLMLFCYCFCLQVDLTFFVFVCFCFQRTILAIHHCLLFCAVWLFLHLSTIHINETYRLQFTRRAQTCLIKYVSMFSLCNQYFFSSFTLF